MNGFHSPGLSYRVIRGRIAQLRTLVALLGVTFMLIAQSHATPITLAFDAIVGPPRQGVDGFVPPSLGVSLQPGDIISGRFTFEPIDAPPDSRETNVVESFPFEINIKSATLKSTQFGIAASNNIHVDVDCVLGDDSCATDYDSITFGCSFQGGDTVCTPNTIAPGDATNWASVISLYAETSALNGADVPSALAVWQQFVPRQGGITVSMDDATAHKFYGFSAQVTSFRQTPEPSAFASVVVTLLSLAVRQVFSLYRKVSQSGAARVFSSS
jgi:hypothetical protein